MNTNNIKRRILGIALCIVLSFFNIFTLKAQKDEYILKCRVKERSDACEMCNHWSINDLYLCYKDNPSNRLNNIITSWTPSDTWQYLTIKVPKEKTLLFRFYDEVPGAWKNLKEVVPSTSSSYVDNYHSWEGGMGWH